MSSKHFKFNIILNFAKRNTNKQAKILDKFTLFNSKSFWWNVFKVYPYLFLDKMYLKEALEISISVNVSIIFIGLRPRKTRKEGFNREDTTTSYWLIVSFVSDKPCTIKQQTNTMHFKLCSISFHYTNVKIFFGEIFLELKLYECLIYGIQNKNI